MAKKPRIPTDGTGDDFRNTLLADQLTAKGFTPSGEAEAPAPAETKQAGGIDLAKSVKIVIRRERKGRGGKTVTIISGIERAPVDLEPIARALRKALGCGAVVEDRTIVVQGDIAPRVQAWLAAHGAKRVVVG